MAKKTNKHSAPSVPTKVASPKTIELKPDHLKLLKDLGDQERAARDKMSFNMLNIDQLKQRRAAVDAQISDIEETKIKPAIKEVYALRNRMTEMGRSFMDFYDLPQREGLRWNLSVDDGAWILMSIQNEK